MRRTGWVIACVAMSTVLSWGVGCGDGSAFTISGTDDDGGVADASTGLDCDAGCPAGFVCVANKCLPPQGPCTPDGGADGGAACKYDTYCDAVTGTCVPFAPGASDPGCHQIVAPGNFAPTIKCEFPTAIPIPNDPFPNHVDVQATPIVVRFGAAAPSILAPFTVPVADNYTEDRGVLRILRGTDCTQEAVLGGVDLDGDSQVDWFRSSSPVAVGDLDGDGLPDIVAYMSSGPGINETLMAFTRKSGTWQPLWTPPKATTDGVTIFKATVPEVASTGKGSWGSPSLHDLDDDGLPEIIREGWVFDGRTGKLRASPPAHYETFRQGMHPVLANLDDDPKIEMTNGARVWEFDGASNQWVEETWYLQTQSSPAG